MKKYNAVHPEHLRGMDTDGIRDSFLVSDLFIRNEITFNYSFEDRNIIGGVYLDSSDVVLGDLSDLGTSYFLERREMGVISILGDVNIILDGVEFILKQNDGLYIPMGTKSVRFSSDCVCKLYFNSVPAHHRYEVAHISRKDAMPVSLGSIETMNKRTIYQYIHPSNCDSCQLLMGMTELELGSCWNTYPPHIHERRMESYFYFNMDEDTRVVELFGEVDQSRHLILKNEEAFISPSYSLHSGVGTGKYSFIWAMAGENKNFDDMDHVDVSLIR